MIIMNHQQNNAHQSYNMLETMCMHMRGAIYGKTVHKEWTHQEIIYIIVLSIVFTTHSYGTALMQHRTRSLLTHSFLED